MATVALIDVSKSVGQTPILDTINLSIQKGEFMAVVGPSGCGKSTLLRLIAGLDELSSGKILINDQCINNIPPAKRDIAMVFQNYALYPHMTVFDNMAYGLKMRKFSRQEIKLRVMEVAEQLRLTPYLDRKPIALSGGQRQRVAMGRAIVRKPAIYLFDEPLSNLDASLRTKMRHEIKSMHQQFNTTSLYVTHDQTEAMTLASRVLVMNQGKVEQVGTPQELYQNPQTLFVAGFTGHYPMNYVSGVYCKQTRCIQTDLGVNYYLSKAHLIDDQSQVTLAVRPEHVQLSSIKSDKSIELNIEFVDDMGADKLIQAVSIKNGERFIVRISADNLITSSHVFVEFPEHKIHVFNQSTGNRIGERDGAN